MLRPRITPCLLVKDKGLVKTVGFEKPKYVGDPINAVKIFNEKEVDELIVLDIDASREQRDPDYGLIENISVECRMPLCYGGGIHSVEQARRVLSLGVEKIAVSSAATSDLGLVTRIAEQLGKQSVVVVMDLKKRRFGSKYELRIINGTKSVRVDPVQFAQEAEHSGAGEIVINAIDADGTMRGYDFKAIDPIRAATSLPITVLGGAGSLDDIKSVFERYGTMGAAAGSLFVFKGSFRAVLINYPSAEEREQLYASVANAPTP